MDPGFKPDPRLLADTVLVAEGPLSQLRLMDDARFPWLVLVPRIAGASEWIDLDGAAQPPRRAEVTRAGHLLPRAGAPAPEKINIGALGNIVRQLHVQVVGRRAGDAAWPGPVWGAGPRQAYVAQAREALLSSLRAHLARLPGP